MNSMLSERIARAKHGRLWPASEVCVNTLVFERFSATYLAKYFRQLRSSTASAFVRLAVGVGLLVESDFLVNHGCCMGDYGRRDA